MCTLKETNQVDLSYGKKGNLFLSPNMFRLVGIFIIKRDQEALRSFYRIWHIIYLIRNVESKSDLIGIDAVKVSN